MKVFIIEVLNTWDNPLFQFEGVFSSRDKAVSYLESDADCGEYLLTSITADTNEKESEEGFAKSRNGKLTLAEL